MACVELVGNAFVWDELVLSTVGLVVFTGTGLSVVVG